MANYFDLVDGRVEPRQANKHFRILNKIKQELLLLGLKGNYEVYTFISLYLKMYVFLYARTFGTCCNLRGFVTSRLPLFKTNPKSKALIIWGRVTRLSELKTAYNES